MRRIALTDKVDSATAATTRRAEATSLQTPPLAAPPTADIEQAEDDREFVTSLARGLAVILAFSQQKRRLSIAQVSHRTGIPRASVRRSLHTLARLGFVAADEGRNFYLRPKILSLGHTYLSATPLSLFGQPILDRLSELLNEACSLAILDGDDIVYLARSTSSRIMSPSLNVGSRLPAYCTSVGLVLLAHLPEDELEAYLARVKFQAFTEWTVTSPKKLAQILKTIRQSGYAIADQQIEIGLRTLAVPVRDTSGAVVAGINVIVQAGRVPNRDMPTQFLMALQRAARELGAMLAP